MAIALGLGASLMAMVYLGAVFGKIDAWPRWSSAIDDFLRYRPARLAARTGVPLAEIGTALWILLDPRRGLLVAGAGFLFLAVAVAVLTTHHTGRECNCFGSFAPSGIGWGLVARNIGLALVAVALGTSGDLPRGSVRPLDVVAGVIVLAIAALLAEGWGVLTSPPVIRRATPDPGNGTS